MFFKPLFIVIASLMLAACGYSTSSLVRPTVPANLLSRCPMVSPLPVSADMADLMESLLNLVSDYTACAAKHDALVEVVNGRGRD